MTSVTLILLKAQILLSLIASTKAVTSQGNLPTLALLSNLIEKILKPDLVDQYVKPYIQALHHKASNPTNKQPEFKVTNDASIEKAIKAKITELKPFLQDNDVDHLDKDENNEIDTTIIEFVPKSKHQPNKTAVFKADIYKYKQVRDKIKRALENESVTAKTKKLIIKTLDDIIAKMITNQCTSSPLDPEKLLRDGKKFDKMLEQSNLTLPEWENFKNTFINFTNDQELQEVFKMFKPFYDYFNNYIKKVGNDNYVVECSINPKKNAKKSLRIVKEKDPCNGFKLCSEELENFLVDFFNSLNDTVVSVFRNYVAMYERDVTVDSSDEKEATISVINKMGDKAETKVIRKFKKELEELTFANDKNAEANVKILKEFILKILGHIKKHTSKHIEDDLTALRTKLLLAVKNDINLNMDVELGNLERDFLSKICRVFVICNGVYIARRTDQPGRNKVHLKDANSLYVKVRVNLDKDVKDTVFRTNRELLGLDKAHRNFRKNRSPVLIDFKYSSLDITRTTLGYNNTDSTTQNNIKQNSTKVSNFSYYNIK